MKELKLKPYNMRRSADRLVTCQSLGERQPTSVYEYVAYGCKRAPRAFYIYVTATLKLSNNLYQIFHAVNLALAANRCNGYQMAACASKC